MDTLPSRQVRLQELSPKHKGVASLLAQGAGREVAAAAFDYTPEYVTWLGGDPLFIAYVKEMSKLVDTRLELLYEKSVDVIAEGLTKGNGEEKLKAARLQLEATQRIGKDRRAPDGGQDSDHLEALSQRLIKLLHQQKERTYEGTAQVVTQE